MTQDVFCGDDQRAIRVATEFARIKGASELTVEFHLDDKQWVAQFAGDPWNPGDSPTGRGNTISEAISAALTDDNSPAVILSMADD